VTRIVRWRGWRRAIWGDARARGGVARTGVARMVARARGWVVWNARARWVGPGARARGRANARGVEWSRARDGLGGAIA